MLKRYNGLFLLAILAIFSCNDDDQVTYNGYLPPIELKDSVVVTYGETLTLALPTEYQEREGTTLTLDFSSNDDLQVNSSETLANLLAEAITINTSENSILIDASEIYPNNVYSEDSDVRLPEVYNVTVNASSEAGLEAVQTSFVLRVNLADLGIVEVSSADEIPYDYALYGTVAEYSIDYNGLESEGTELDLFFNGRPDGHVNLVEGKIVVDEDAGDENKESEWTYDLIPTLTKDGYMVARKQFRVMLVPKPKFFYGSYYPDLDITVIQNRLVMALGNEYATMIPAFYPEKYRGSFSIKSISKDGNAFEDTEALFSIDEENGRVSVQGNTSLTAGEYTLVVENESSTTDFVLEAELTLVME
ncbi:hypothetical protein LVD15_01940 [Fulvivirga maritima]|uniref:hypothetical protein n=1 Tax=Fulvivirga maritima TaxID=2904247 RepID=UPI001F3E6E9F|nr:hypothetical protein [Fulvivirga maritima]UII27211.1 hypothetical protein LVD15_01940 [Fulvivirga maritima]